MTTSPHLSSTVITSTSELRSAIVSLLTYEGQRRRFEPAAMVGVNPPPSSALPVLRCTLPNGEPLVLQLDAAKHKANLYKFTGMLAELRELTTDPAGLEQLERVEALLGSEAGQANLEALWQLWHRAVYSSQCEGRILTPELLIDALYSLVAPYTAQAEAQLGAAGAYLGLAVLGAVEPGLQGLADRCERREREVAERDEALAGAYSRLGFQLRSLQALVARFVADRQYSRSALLAPRDLGELRSLVQQQGLATEAAQCGIDDVGCEGAESLEALLWALQEGPPARLEAWTAALESGLDAAGSSEDRRLLFRLSPTWQGPGRRAAVQSVEFIRAQEVALEVLATAAVTVDLSDRLRPSLSAPRGSAQAHGRAQACLLGVAGASLALTCGHVGLLRDSGSPLLEGLLAGYGVALELAEEVQRREVALRVEEAEARAANAELICRELQLQAAMQRRMQREVLRAQQQLVAVWFSVVEAQVDLSKAQRQCLEEANRQFRAATLQLTVPEVPDPLSPLSPLGPRDGSTAIDAVAAAAAAAGSEGQPMARGSGAGSEAASPTQARYSQAPALAAIGMESLVASLVSQI